MATVIQIIGAALIVAGIGLFSIPAAVIVAGVAAVLFGIALERN
jgi:uncharacterized membrane-anchored protein YitT (DUF2179 family)